MSNFNSADIAAFKDVWVFCEQREGKLMPTDFELISEGRKLADELLRAVLGKMAIPRLDGGNGLIDTNGLGHGNEARGVVGAARAIERRIKTFQNLLAASAHQVQIVIHC